MHKIDQEYFFDKGEVGDCVRAVTASILDMDRKDVPHFVKDNPGHQWYEHWETFMKNNGIFPHMLTGPWEKTPVPIGYYLASGPVSRGCKHIVIMENGKLYHDPHPSREGLQEIEAIWMLLPAR